MVRTIEVHPYDPSWREKFNEEVEMLKPIFGEQLVSIHHIGSTAIPGIKAKPVIDILIVVTDIDAIQEAIDQMESNGYEYRGENGIPGRRYLRKDTNGIRSYHAHIYQDGHPNIAKHLNFRDYLRAHTEHAQEYSRLKEDLAIKFRHSSVEYTEGKSDFINRTIHLAEEWHRTGTP